MAGSVTVTDIWRAAAAAQQAKDQLSAGKANENREC
jgi:hypothetical protein